MFAAAPSPIFTVSTLMAPSAATRLVMRQLLQHLVRFLFHHNNDRDWQEGGLC
jgi:hypothetical protein